MTTRIHRAIWREAVRVRRSAIPSFTPLLAVGIGAVIGGFFLLALSLDPQIGWGVWG